MHAAGGDRCGGARGGGAAGRRAAPSRPAKPADWRRLERELSDLLGCAVQLSADKSGQGELKLAFHSLDELDGLLARLGYEAR